MSAHAEAVNRAAANEATANVLFHSVKQQNITTVNTILIYREKLRELRDVRRDGKTLLELALQYFKEFERDYEADRDASQREGRAPIPVLLKKMDLAKYIHDTIEGWQKDEESTEQ